MNDRRTGLQLVFLRRIEDWSFHCRRWEGGMRLIYRWSLQIGPFEIRRWESRTLTEMREAGEWE